MNISKSEFYDKCFRHDWYARMSDDYSVVKRAEAERDTLRHLANQNPEFRPILERFAHAFMAQKAKPTKEECGIHDAG